MLAVECALDRLTPNQTNPLNTNKMKQADNLNGPAGSVTYPTKDNVTFITKTIESHDICLGKINKQVRVAQSND